MFEVKKIHDRFKGAVVVSFKGETEILLPTREPTIYFSLSNGSTGWDNNWCTLHCDWTLRIGDRCLMADREDGVWEEDVFSGISKGILKGNRLAFQGKFTSSRFMKPVPILEMSPEKKTLMDQINKLENTLKSHTEELVELKRKAEEM